MLYIKATRQAYDQNYISDVVWIQTQDNPAGLTKFKKCPALEEFLDPGRLKTDVEQLVVRRSVQREETGKDEGDCDRISTLGQSFVEPDCGERE